DDDKISGVAVVVASDLVEMVAAGVGWWHDGDDDDGGWSHGGGDVYGGGVVVRRLWVMMSVDLWCGSGCGGWPEIGRRRRLAAGKREENGG
ncbi:hypothetical protein Tco_1390326, partial [Tanacetum coccineum]